MLKSSFPISVGTNKQSEQLKLRLSLLYIKRLCFPNIHKCMYIFKKLQLYNPDFQLQLKQIPTKMFPVTTP